MLTTLTLPSAYLGIEKGERTHNYLEERDSIEKGERQHRERREKA